jgi:CubicO group peptidase (beta-lactamase class C family)
MTRRSIESALADTMATGRVPGLAAAVVADGVLQGTAVAGTADVRTSVPVSVDTAFLWFSMTKIATATATMRLVERGLLALDDEVAALVPGVLPPADGAAVTVRHLLQHSSGIPNPPPVRWVRPADARTVVVMDGVTDVSEGTHLGTDGAVGGFVVLEAEDLAAAVDVASRIPAARLGGAIEVRPVAKYW